MTKKTLLTFLWASIGFGCTVFQHQNTSEIIVGKNYDWDLGHGFVMTNPRGNQKTALKLSSSDKPAQWTSKFSSLTFNQHGLEFPLSGINEKGLVVEILWLRSSEYAPPDSRPVINELQWIQYQLDNFASVSEALNGVDKIRLKNVKAKVHYYMCDAYGDCATVEFLKGNTIVHTSKALEFKALTNDTYSDSLAYMKKHVGYGGEQAFNESSDASLDRFARAVRDQKTSTLTSAFDLLDKVVSGNESNTPTQWQIVYAPQKKTVRFRTAEQRETKEIHFEALIHGCETPSKMLNMEESLSGDVTLQFETFSKKKNSWMIRKSLPSFVEQMLAAVLEKYPSTVKCTATTQGF